MATLPDPEERKQAEALLRDAPFAYLGVVDGGGPFVVPMNFAWVPAGPGFGLIYLHTGPGRKSAALAIDPRICLAIAGGAAFQQGATPCQDGFAFHSVIVEGQATLLADPAERETGLRAIVSKYDPAAAAEPLDDRLLARTLVYRVAIETLSYRAT